MFLYWDVIQCIRTQLSPILLRYYIEIMKMFTWLWHKFWHVNTHCIFLLAKSRKCLSARTYAGLSLVNLVRGNGRVSLSFLKLIADGTSQAKEYIN